MSRRTADLDREGGRRIDAAYELYRAFAIKLAERGTPLDVVSALSMLDLVARRHGEDAVAEARRMIVAVERIRMRGEARARRTGPPPAAGLSSFRSLLTGIDYLPSKKLRAQLRKLIADDMEEIDQFASQGRWRLVRWRTWLVYATCAWYVLRSPFLAAVGGLIKRIHGA